MINSLLFSITNMAPAMLSVGRSKTENYDALAEVTNSLYGTSITNNSSSSKTSDQVSLALGEVRDKIIQDMAAETAAEIKQHPELDGEYLIAIIDNGASRDARVFKRSDILNQFEGTEAEKAAFKEQLDKNPLVVYSSGANLPPSATDEASNSLRDRINQFLKTNKGTIDILNREGYNPFSGMKAA